MRILFATTGGAGHFGPLIPFARACVDGGHDVRVAAPDSFAESVKRAGLAPAPFPDAPRHLLGAAFARIPALTMRTADELVVREVFGRIDTSAALPAVQALMREWHPDVVVREPAELSSYVAAEQLQGPQVQVNIGLDSFLDKLQVLDEPLEEFGSKRGAVGFLQLTRWTLVPPSFDRPAARATSSPVAFRGESAPPGDADVLPAWWPDNGRPLVYVTFGSVAASLGMLPDFYRNVLELLAEVPVRVLLTLGEAGSPDALGTLPPNAHVERWWPQADVMPHAAAVVSHGGFGTTLLALAARVPQVVMPLFASDQFDNARRVAAVGAGVNLEDADVDQRLAGDMIPAGPHAVEQLPSAVIHVIGDRDSKAAARRIAEEIDRLPAVHHCVAALDGALS